MASSKSLFAASLGLLASVAQAQIFTLNCAPLLIERGDPILSPGEPGPQSHVHAIVGGTGFNVSMSYTLAQGSKNTTCNRPFDHSDYWQPQLYNNPASDKYELIPFEGASVYYFNRACDYAPGRTVCPKDFKPAAPPSGMRIISGNSTYRSYNPQDKMQQAQHVQCINEATGGSTWPGLPKANCTRVIAETMFPSCWNGKDIDSSDHFSHMAFPTQRYNGGVCPESHPKAIYTVFYQFFYDTRNYQDYKQWTFSMGDPTGYGLHGDFLQGWTNQTALEDAINTCTGPNGPDKYPCSTAAGIGPSVAMFPEYPAVNEDVGLHNPLTKLPGDHPPLGSWTDRADKLSGSAN